MDNITPLVPATKSTCIIMLNPFQHEYYEQSCIEIRSPDGEHLESIGYDIQKDATQNNEYQLRDHICLVGCLLGNINQEIELPAQAVSGLADLMYRMQDFCGRYSK